MAKYICPSCGAPYNGKKCRNCAYESFSEEIAHNLHVHEGEPLVIHDTTRRPVPYKDPFDCPPSHPKKGKKSRSGGLSKVLLIVFIAIFLCNVLPILFASVIDHAESDIHSETVEAVTLPLDGKTLLDDESFSIVAQWQDGKDDRTDIPIYIVNHTDREYEFSSQNVTVNGYCLDDFCSFYADVPSGETVKGTLYLSDTGLATANIAQIQQIKKMGNLKDLASMIPGMGKMLKNVDIPDDVFKQTEAIISSMTPAEREHPEIINARRRERIAKGSGTTMADVNRLMKQFDDTRKMMKAVAGGGMKMPKMPGGMMRR